MTSWKPRPMTEDIRMWIICHAVGEEHGLIGRMKRDEDGNYPVFFSVGGVELNFDNVAKRIEEIFDDAVTKKAQKLLDEKYDNLLEEIDDVRERIKAQKEKFKYDWED